MDKFSVINLNIFTSILLSLTASPFTYGQDKSEDEPANSSLQLDSAKLTHITPSMITIPAGFYEFYCHPDEVCLHAEINTFEIMEHELTWSMYQPCIDNGVCTDNTAIGGGEGWGKGDRPIINVSFTDVSEHYIPWLNNQTGLGYRLPSEAEWEYAATAGSSTYYYWGDEAGIGRANCAGFGSEWDNGQTAPVKSFAPNSFGLYDMHGNVWELTTDCWDGADRKGTSVNGARVKINCEQRIIRGGSFVELPHVVGRGARASKGKNRRQRIFGFRLVRDI